MSRECPQGVTIIMGTATVPQNGAMGTITGTKGTTSITSTEAPPDCSKLLVTHLSGRELIAVLMVFSTLDFST